MLVLTRKLGEKVVIGDHITLTVVEIRGNQVRLAFDAPAPVRIMRGELVRNQHRSVRAPELLDPDLKEKPAEWKHDTRYVVINPADSFQATAR